MKKTLKILHIIDHISIWAGKTVSWIALILIGLICFEVISRYIFNAPTIWTLELTVLLFAVMWLLSGGWATQANKHIRVDVFYNRLSPRRRAIVDVCLAPFVVLFGIVIFKVLLNFGLQSMEIREHAPTVWGPPIWIIKMLLPISVGILFLQLLAGIVRSAYFAIKGKELLAETVQSSYTAIKGKEL